MGEVDNGAVTVRSGSSIIDVRMWLDQSPWRIAAGWTVLAALLASGASMDYVTAHASTLVLLFLLADPLWGSVWGLMSTPNSLPFLQQSMQRSRVWLPYLRSGSPAARLFGMDGPSILAIVYRVALPAIFLALLVSLILPPVALWLTLAVVVVSSAGWLHQQVELIPVTLLHVLLTVALPWLLIVFVVGTDTDQTFQLALAALWSIHVWGSQTYHDGGRKVLALAAIAASQAGIGVLFIFLQLPLWLVFFALFSLPTWLALYQGQSLERVRLWWMAAMLTSGLALGQVV